MQEGGRAAQCTYLMPTEACVEFKFLLTQLFYHL